MFNDSDMMMMSMMMITITMTVMTLRVVNYTKGFAVCSVITT